MEVGIQNNVIKQEQVEDNNSRNQQQNSINNYIKAPEDNQSQRILISPTNHLSGGGIASSATNNTVKYSNTNNNLSSILQNTLTNNNNNNFSTSGSFVTGSSVSSPNNNNISATPIIAATAKTANNNNNNIYTSSKIPPASAATSSPIITTTLNGEQLASMAKSSGLSIVHVSLPQTVIQTPSVIQSASGHLQLSKGNVILVSSKPSSSVIQTTGGPIQTQTVQLVKEAHSDESNDGVDHPSGTSASSVERERRRRDILTRRPSYRKILNDLGASEIAEKGDSSATSESSQDPLDNPTGNFVQLGGNQYPQSVVKVINTTMGLGANTSADANSATALQTITMTNAGTAGGTIVQYAQSHDGQQFFVPVGGELQAYTIRPVSSSASSSPSVVVGGGGHHVPEEATRKREIRLLKNREAARECRRKKKEYIKCLENRVAVLENQNKALIDELKSLKELYCQQKTE